MKRYALVVGIGDYKYLKDLSKPVNDAQTVHDLLKAEGNFQAVRLLNRKVTAANLKETLKQVILQQAKDNDLLLYFTGHGLAAGDEFEQKGFLATYDCEVTLEGKTIVASSNGVSFTWLNNLIKKANLSSLVMFLDCCESGFAIENALLEDSLKDLAKKNCFFAAACRNFEKAYALKSAEHSFFTGALLEALQQHQGKVTTSDVLSFTENKLRGARQEPVYLGRGSSIVLLDRRQQIQPDQVSDQCPYQGLNAFTRQTRQFFHGRAEKVSEIFDRLDRCNFVPVVGPSGIGKSSVVRAGLLPQLEDFGWHVLVMKPDDQPMTRLRLAVKDWLDKQDDLSRREQQRLTKVFDDDGLRIWAEALPGSEHLLLLVDQFEEVFTLRKEGGPAPKGQPLPDEQTEFIQQILAVSGLPESRLKVVTTMRSDFIDPWLATGQPPNVVQQQTVYLGPLQAQNLTDAIVKPAQTQGYAFGPGLLELILNDVETEPNSLPLLEFALTELWERRDRDERLLTAAAYRQMQGLKGALNKRAEEEYAKLSESEQKRIKQVCLALVRIGRNQKDTRRRRLKIELLDLGTNEVDKETIQYVIDGFVAGRLLVTDGDETSGYVDIAHEALMAGWQRFGQWRQENRDQRRLVQRLEDAYDEWVDREKNDKYLLQGGLLEEWRDLDAQLANVLLPRGEVRSFFTRSDEQEQENVAKLKQALAEVHLEAEASKIRSKLTNMPQYTVEATLDAIDAVGYSLKSFKGEVRYPIKDALNRTWRNLREVAKMQGHGDAIWSVAFSPDGSRIVSGSADSTLRLWDSRGNPIGKPWVGHSDWIWSVAFSPDGSRIVSGSRDTNLRLWSIDGQSIGSPLEGHLGSVLSVAFSPQGDRIISTSDDGTLRFWDANGLPLGSPIEAHEGSVYSVAFSPDGNRIVSGGADNTLRLWDLKGNSIGEPFEGHSDWVRSVAFNPDGNRIISGGADKRLHLWELDGKCIQQFYGHDDLVYSVAFSPDGEQIVSSSRDHTVRLWDLDGTLVDKPLYGHHGLVYSVAFSPTEGRIVSGSADHTLRIWNTQGNPILKSIQAHSAAINALAFSPTGEKLVSGSSDTTLRIWDSQGCAIGQMLSGHKDTIWALAFSPNGERFVSGGSDKKLRIWDQDGNPLGEPIPVKACINALAFSPSGERFVSGSSDKKLRIWDQDGNLLGEPIPAHDEEVETVAFNPDGTKFASGSYDHYLCIWNSVGELITQSKTQISNHVNALAFNSAGDLLISGDSNNNLQRWDYDGKPIGEPMQGHLSPVTFVAFSPKDDWIVSGSHDRTIRLWACDGRPIGEPIGEPIEHQGWGLTALAVSPVGNQIVFSGFLHQNSSWKDGVLWFWDSISWQDWLHRCCKQLIHHRDLLIPRSDTAQRACQVCMDHAWTRGERAEFLVAQGKALAYYQQDVNGAVAKFEEALGLDGTVLEVAPRALAEKIKGWGASL
ncbi:WD40 repeat-containing protein [Leptolyngbya sp. PCC 7375]|nr:WD40 repeat-containing protein [Leptolyngbya sp. PCC 7375]